MKDPSICLSSFLAGLPGCIFIDPAKRICCCLADRGVEVVAAVGQQPRARQRLLSQSSQSLHGHIPNAPSGIKDCPLDSGKHGLLWQPQFSQCPCRCLGHLPVAIGDALHKHRRREPAIGSQIEGPEMNDGFNAVTGCRVRKRSNQWRKAIAANMHQRQKCYVRPGPRTRGGNAQQPLQVWHCRSGLWAKNPKANQPLPDSVIITPDQPHNGFLEWHPPSSQDVTQFLPPRGRLVSQPPHKPRKTVLSNMAHGLLGLHHTRRSVIKRGSNSILAQPLIPQARAQEHPRARRGCILIIQPLTQAFPLVTRLALAGAQQEDCRNRHRQKSHQQPNDASSPFHALSYNEPVSAGIPMCALQFSDFSPRVFGFRPFFGLRSSDFGFPPCNRTTN